MSLKWTGCDSGILRKSEFKEKKEELFVFGYSCKLFREDEKALHIDQGKHLIPWMGDETLKIDRYDARGALHDLSTLEAPPGGYDWRVELNKMEQEVEQLCDEERYRALHTNEDEEEMYKEEELKRLHAAGYGQVGFNYDTPEEPKPSSQPAEVDEPFEPTPSFVALLPNDIVLPETQKQNAIIEKTAKFIASQGVQMEILIKAKQCDNPQFQFLNKDSVLHPYYTALIGLVKAGKWPEKEVQVVVEEKHHENEDYLHPSLASTIIESAPSIPSIHYKPSADCDYTMLICKMLGSRAESCELAPGEVPPPGTEPLPMPPAPQITRPPVMYNTSGIHVEPPAPPQVHYQQYAAYYHQYLASQAALAQAQIQQKPFQIEPSAPTTLKSTGLSLMKNYNTDSDSDISDFDDSSSTDSKDKPSILEPPDDVNVIIDKMAAYVARNGDEFADIVRAKNDPRFTFLDPDHIYHPYYKRLMQQKRGIDVNGKEKKGGKKKSSAPVSFSIKKLKEPDPILPKPALPYESSSDDDPEKQVEKQEEPNELPKSTFHIYPMNNIPPPILYRIEQPLTNNISEGNPIEIAPKITPVIVNEVKEEPIKDLPIKDITIKDITIKDIPNKVITMKDIPNKDITMKDIPNKDIPIKDIPIKDITVKDIPIIVMPINEVPKGEVKIITPILVQEKNEESPPKIEIREIKEVPIVKEEEKIVSEKREVEKRVSEKRDLEKRDSERRDSEKRDSEKRDSEKRDTERRDSEKRDSERRDSEKRDSERRDSEKREMDKVKDSHRRDKRKHKDRKREREREYRSKSESRDSKKVYCRSVDRDREKRKDRDGRDKKRKRHTKEMDMEIISLEDNSDDLIDLTGDQSDSRGDFEMENERSKQLERRRRAAEFLKKVGVDPAAAALPTSSLASAMVDTLESIRKKKADEEEKRRRREKRRHRERRDYEDESERSHRKSKRRKCRSSDDEESDYDGSKKKKRKKEKKHSSKNKKKRRKDSEIGDQPLSNIDLMNTLKELRTSSPTKELGLQVIDDRLRSARHDFSSDEEKLLDKKRKEEREYSEGEWSSDSEGDSVSTASKRND